MMKSNRKAKTFTRKFTKINGLTLQKQRTNIRGRQTQNPFMSTNNGVKR